jgi:hypothetical protein
MSVSTRVLVNDGKVHIHRQQDCDPFTQDAAQRRQDGNIGSSEMRHAARFPMVIVEQYLAMHQIDYQEFIRNPEHLKRMLNDPALAAFRIWEGKT